MTVFERGSRSVAPGATLALPIRRTRAGGIDTRRVLLQPVEALGPAFAMPIVAARCQSDGHEGLVPGRAAGAQVLAVDDRQYVAVRVLEPGDRGIPRDGHVALPGRSR